MQLCQDHWTSHCICWNSIIKLYYICSTGAQVLKVWPPTCTLKFGRYSDRQVTFSPGPASVSLEQGSCQRGTNRSIVLGQGKGVLWIESSSNCIDRESDFSFLCSAKAVSSTDCRCFSNVTLLCIAREGYKDLSTRNRMVHRVDLHGCPFLSMTQTAGILCI